jgi:PBSX family phage terminase large subunit
MPEVRISQIIGPAFFPVHQSIRREEHSEYWLKGGRGSAKSSFISLEIVQGIVRDPEANAIIYRKVADTLRDSVYAQMVWAIGVLGLAAWFKCKLSPMEIIYVPTGQRIMFRGADDPGKSKSIKLDRGYFKYLWFEELTEFGGMDDIRTIKASIIRGGGHAISFASYNPPKSANNWSTPSA